MAITNQRLAALGATSGYVELEEEMVNLIDVNNVSITSFGEAVSVIKGLAAGLAAIIRLDLDNVKNAYDAAYNASRA
jgi:hypothetical protein